MYVCTLERSNTKIETDFAKKERERKKERKKLLQFGVIHTNVLHACRKGERERKG